MKEDITRKKSTQSNKRKLNSAKESHKKKLAHAMNLEINTGNIKEKHKVNIFDAYDNAVRRGILKASLDNGTIDEKRYLNEVKGLSEKEKSISDFAGEKKHEHIVLKEYTIEDEEITSTIEFITELFKGKTSKLNGEPAVNHSIGVAAILAKYNVLKQSIIVGLLHDVIEDIEDGEAKLRQKGYSEEIISLVKELSEDKGLPWKERKKQYMEHLKDASNDIKIISAADKLYNIRSFLDDYLIEQDEMRNRFNAGKDEQIEFLENYMKALKNNFSHPIIDELENVVKRFLKMIK